MVSPHACTNAIDKFAIGSLRHKLFMQDTLLFSAKFVAPLANKKAHRAARAAGQLAAKL
jgi:hypothetical protein